MNVDRRLVLLGVLLLGACGGAEPREEEEQALAAPELEGAPAAGVEGAARLGARDLEAYERGMMAELEAVRQAGVRRAEARTADDTLNALSDAGEMRTVEAGARAAGMSVDRYREIRRAVEEVLRAGSRTEFVQQQTAGLDTTDVPPEFRARIREQIQEQERSAAQARQAAYGSLPPELVPEFESRAPRLDSLRLRLAAERVRAAEGR